MARRLNNSVRHVSVHKNGTPILSDAGGDVFRAICLCACREINVDGGVGKGIVGRLSGLDVAQS